MAVITAAVTIGSVAGSLYTSALSVAETIDITAAHTEGVAIISVTNGSKQVATDEVVYEGGSYNAPAYLFLKNRQTTTGESITIYDDSNGDVDVLKLGPGDWAYLPLAAANTLKAHGSAGGHQLQKMVFGTQI
jgi:hypothetical protein